MFISLNNIALLKNTANTIMIGFLQNTLAY